MSRTPNQFIDPSAVLSTYSWQVNHSEEGGTELSRPINHTANTSDTGLVRQQGDPAPLVLSYSGVILHRAQHVQFLKWWQACKTRTIFFRDALGDEYEVIITRYKAPRVRVAQNPQDPVNAPLNIWNYEIDLEVVTVRDGVLDDAGISVP